MNDRNLLEEKTVKKSMVGAFVLAVWGVAMALATESSVIMLDGMFNLITGFMSYFSIIVTRLVSGKKTTEFPLGYFAFESFFVFIKGASILILVAMSLYIAIETLLAGGRVPALGLMTIYVGLAVLGCLILWLVNRSGYKKTGSEILEAETTAWLINTVISGSIGVAFVITMLIQKTPWGWIDRYMDQILVIALSLLFIKDPLVLIKNGLKELLLAAPQREYAEPYEKKIFPLQEELGASRLRLEILKTGRRMWVTVFMDPKEDTIRVQNFLDMKERLREVAREVYDNTDTEVILERI